MCALLSTLPIYTCLCMFSWCVVARVCHCGRPFWKKVLCYFVLRAHLLTDGVFCFTSESLYSIDLMWSVWTLGQKSYIYCSDSVFSVLIGLGKGPGDGYCMASQLRVGGGEQAWQPSRVMEFPLPMHCHQLMTYASINRWTLLSRLFGIWMPGMRHSFLCCC
jgi:hypothetical protein